MTTKVHGKARQALSYIALLCSKSQESWERDILLLPFQNPALLGKVKNMLLCFAALLREEEGF